MNSPSDPSGELSQDKQALLALRKMRARLDEIERARTEPIAIVGMACRFPQAPNPESYWRLLRDGVNAITEVPADRWDVDAFYDPDPDAAGKMYTRRGGFLENVDLFDPEHFSISPREATMLDPQQRLLLELTWEALEDAAYAPDRLAGSDTGVFVGISTNDYGQLLMRSVERERDGSYLGTGNLLSAAAGRLSYTLGFQGPSMAVDTACSSSLVAIHLASQALRNRECTMAIAGGVNIVLSPLATVDCCRARMLAPDGHCKAFDAAADGYVRGDGCGMIVLKRLSDAVAAGDRIHALLRGAAVNQDGRSGGFTAPNELAQQAVIRKALKAAQVAPADVSYLEAHGTGTSLGDPIELHAIAAAYGVERADDRPLTVGSAKTNIGHLESAAGVAGVIKVVLAMRHQEIPAHLHFKSLNPHLSIDGFPLVIPRARTPWPAGDRPRLAAVSSFGFTGTNAHAILEEAPRLPVRADAPDRPTHVLALSARNEAGLRDLAARYASSLETTDDAFADICFTANTGRAQFDHRLAVTAASIDEAREALVAAAAAPSIRTRSGRAPKGRSADVVFLFTGQGAQFPGMARALYETQPAFRRTLARCDAILRTELERPLLSVLYPAAGETSPIGETMYTQPALFAVEYALAELWRAWGIEPAAVIGHSIGELVAACVAGVFSLEDGLKLVAARARLMQALPGDGGMAAVFASEARVRTALAGMSEVVIAAINDPENTVIAGPRPALETVLGRLTGDGVKTQQLAVSHAFHSPLMEPMLDEFGQAAARIAYAPAQVGFVSNVTGDFVEPSFTFGADYWRRHAREAVRFADGLAAIHARGHRVFLEIGPSTTLLAMGQRAIGEAAWLPSLRKGRGDWDQLVDTAADLWVRGAAIDWAGFDRDYPRRKVTVPGYPFQRQRYWATVDPTLVSAEARSTGIALKDDTYSVRWVALPGAEPATDAEKPASFAVVTHDTELGAALDAQFERDGALCTVMTTDGDGDDPAWYQRLVETLLSGSRHDAILLVADGGAAPSEVDAASLGDGDAVCRQLIAIVQALAQSKAGSKRPRVWVITRGAQAVGASDALYVPHAPVWGLGRIVALEHPEIWGGLIDLDPNGGASPSAAAIAGHVRSTAAEDQIAFRGGRAFVPRLELAQPIAARELSLAADATYVITGGLGSLGLALAERLVERGARHLTLVGRRALPERQAWTHVAPSSDAGRQIAALQRLESAGAQIRIVAADIGRRQGVEALFGTLRQNGPAVRGVFHAAGVSQVAPVVDLTRESLRAMFDAKVAGTWWLHEATRDLRLDFFVLFSSISAVWGSKGLGAYGAGNHFLDAVAHHRRRLGLPALSVNWGPWAQGGMLRAPEEQWLASMGIAALQPADALDALEGLITGADTQVVVSRVDWATFLPIYEARASRPFVERVARLASEPASGGSRGLASGATPGAARADAAARTTVEERAARIAELMQANAPDRRHIMAGFCARQLAEVLHRDSVPAEASLSELGVDSLMAIELRNRIQRTYGASLPVVAFLEAESVDWLAGTVLDAIDASNSSAPAAPVAAAQVTPAEAERLLSRMDELSESEVDALLSVLAADRSSV
jgi:acyl transferase domain-containing protein